MNLNPDGTLSLGVPAQSATPLANGTVATSAALSSTDAKAAYAALGGSVLNTQERSHFPLLSLNDTNVFSLGQEVIELPEFIPLLNIVVGFEDMPYCLTYDWNQTFFESEYSTQAFWKDASNGAFTFIPAQEESASREGGSEAKFDEINDGVVYVSLARSHGNWHNDFGDEAAMNNFMDALQNALDLAAENVDFASFDKNGDGTLSTDEIAINFIVAGYESSYNDTLEYGLWAHAASEIELEAGGLTMHNYISMGERLFNGQIERSNRASTVTHELGHYLGLPDLYDTMGIEGGAWQGFNVDGLSVMASGSWGTDIPETSENLAEVTAIPVRLDPLCSYLLGFSTPVDITETGTYDIQASKTENGYEFYVMQVPGTDEYFLVENRIPQGFDRGLCGLYGTDTTGGIVVWHYDASAWEEYTATNTVNTTDHRPALMPAYIEERFESGNQHMATFRTVAGYEKNARTATSYTDVLLRYGAGELADDPDARTASGFGVFALSDAQDSASFKAVVTDAAETADATILFTNDVHGAGLDPESEGLTYASIAALKYDARTALGTGNVVLVDAGDAVQGDAIAELSEGSVPIEAMGAAGYDLAVPGEHEFDYGTGRFKQLEAQAAELGMTYRSANIDNLAIESGGAFSRLLLNEYGYGMSKFLIDGVPTKVGFVCVTTPEALIASSPSNFQDKNGNIMVSFCEDETGQTLYDRVQANIDWLRSDSMGCEYVVAVGHLGNQDVTPRWSSKEVIANTTGIDVFIDGHSHEQVNTQTPDKNGKDVLLVQTGAKLSSIGKLTLDSDGFDVEFITAESYAKKDADVTRALEGYQEEYQEELPETPDEETGDNTDQGSGDAEHEGSGTEPNTPSEDNASSNASLAETGDNPALLLACIAVACAAGIALIAAARRIAPPSE